MICIPPSHPINVFSRSSLEAQWRLSGGLGLGVEAEFTCLASGDLPLETGMETTGVREQSGFGWEVSKALFCLVAVGTVASLVCTKRHLCLIRTVDSGKLVNASNHPVYIIRCIAVRKTSQ